MDIQSDIEYILDSHHTKEQKLSLLRKFFTKNNTIAFVDFDDTISDNSCLFYTKIKFLLKYKTSNEQKVFDHIIKQFSLNKRFVALLHKKNIHQVLILSRNNHRFLHYFTKWFKTHYPSADFSFIGHI